MTAGPDDRGAFQVQPLAIPIYIEGSPRLRRTRSADDVRGYAIALGWWPNPAGPQTGIDADAPPELFYLVADPQLTAPVWVREENVSRHFRSQIGSAVLADAVPPPPR